MNHNTTEKGLRQVQKTSSKQLWQTAEVYYTRQGENFINMTYLARSPIVGKGGRKEAMGDTKETANIKRSMKTLVGVIRANFGYNLYKEAHLTITYQGKMTDTDKLQKDLQAFVRKLRNAYKDHQLEYIAVMEPHAHGGWHIHLLLKSSLPLWHSGGVSGLSYAKTRRLWRSANGTGAGAVRHSEIPNQVEGSVIKDIGAYFVAYFTTAIPEDIELTGDRKAIKEASKQAQKGSRLHFYPSNFKFYRTSQGIIKPKQEKGEYGEIFTEDFENTYCGAFEIYNDSGESMQFVQRMELQRK